MTFWFWFVVIVSVIFWTIDAHRFFVSGKPTFSYAMVTWTKRYPLLPFLVGLAIGVFAGHFWQNSACWEG
jgi:hypothetical protein